MHEKLERSGTCNMSGVNPGAVKYAGEIWKLYQEKGGPMTCIRSREDGKLVTNMGGRREHGDL